MWITVILCFVYAVIICALAGYVIGEALSSIFIKFYEKRRGKK